MQIKVSLKLKDNSTQECTAEVPTEDVARAVYAYRKSDAFYGKGKGPYLNEVFTNLIPLQHES